MKNVISMIYLSKRIKRAIEARILKRWGSILTKKSIWDEEFVSGQWDYIDHTGDDVIYLFLNKYANKGSILDLGCGSGNTGNEMDVFKYESYTGVDISEIAIQKALSRSKKNHRQEKNEYVCYDISSFVPRKRYDIILFRESIFYLPKNKITDVLKRYSNYLKKSGVLIVRMCDRRKYKAIVKLIEKHYHILERSPADDANIILVFK